MKQEQSFKKKLAMVFDEDLRTRPLKWNNWVDILIIVMIVLSTVVVFLGTFELSPAWQKYGCNVNAFTIRISTKLLCFDARVHSVLYRMAEVINEQLHGQGMIDSDRKDFEERLFGYPEVAKK